MKERSTSPRHALHGGFRVSGPPFPRIARTGSTTPAPASDDDRERIRRAARLEFVLAVARQGYPRAIESMCDIAEENQRLRELVRCLVDNDPNEIVAGRLRILDVWRQAGRDILRRR